MYRAWIAAASLCLTAVAQEGYKLPPKEVVDLLDAKPSPTVRPSPNALWLLLVDRPAMPSIADVSRPWVGLAGLRVDVARNAPQQLAFDEGLLLMGTQTGYKRRVELPAGARIGGLSWSHTSLRFAFTLVRDDGVDLWACETESATPKLVAKDINTMFGGFDWMPSGDELTVKLVPAKRGAAPANAAAPTGPTTMESAGRKSPARTLQDLLKDEPDCRLFEHLTLSQLAVIDLKTGATRLVGEPGLYTRVDPSPDGQHLLVDTLRRPFSFVFGLDRFPRVTQVWSTGGALEKTVLERGLADQIPIEGVETGPRNIGWRVGEPATLVWLEALDGGDPKTKVEQRDKWMALTAPFSEPPRELLRVQHRARGLTWFSDPNLVLAGEYDRDRRWTRSTLHDLSGAQAPRVLEDRSVNERYANPGSLSMTVQPDGTRVVRQAGDYVFRTGEGDSPEGARPFLDRQSLASGAAERLWRCEEGVYESVAAIASISANAWPSVLTRRESPVEPPNTFARDLEAKTVKQLTHFADPQPQIRGIGKQLVKYTRADGVQLSATLYTPANYRPGTRLPLVVWAYPNEVIDAATAGQITGSPHRFTLITGLSQLVFVTQGYAVMDDAAMPILGDPETMNDTFLPQIESAARAAIEHAASLGVGDPERVGVGGHSYGAFMTANLLAHTDLFKAGCARSGAYNRTLTPFGFQSERRTLWEALDAYAAVSPFLHADKINEPLLMIHGEKDSNPGTFPMQSERLYQAVAGLGGTARLVILPEESHGYRARESVLHTAAEMLEWFDRYVKTPVAREASALRGG